MEVGAYAGNASTGLIRLTRGRVTNPAPLFNARYHPRLGGGWWSPAVELPLPELYRRPPRRPRPYAVVGSCERGRGALDSAQRLARPAHAARRPPRALAPQRARLAYRLRGPHGRRNRPHARAPLAARERDTAPGVRPRWRDRTARRRVAVVSRSLRLRWRRAADARRGSARRAH